jgi:hypothetical protein
MTLAQAATGAIPLWVETAREADESPARGMGMRMFSWRMLRMKAGYEALESRQFAAMFPGASGR